MKKLLYAFLAILLVAAFLPFKGHANDENNKVDLDLWNAVKPLETTVTFLNTGAHPDDERSDFLAYLSRGLGVKTSSLIANRGEGGQNEIGNELGNALGIIRSREMIEAAKITGVKAYHLSETTSDPIYDFGFSKSPEETLKNWGEDVTYERLIRFIRTYQPDIVMPSFRNVDSQHGHHRTMEILSERAFKDAADPKVFPDQLKEGLSTWQIKKFYLPSGSDDPVTTTIEIGDYDPIYGMTYPQLGEQSRYMHKSQGMGSDIPAEPRQVKLELLFSTKDANDSSSLFAGIPYNFAEWAQILPPTENDLKVQLAKLQQNLNSITDSYPSRASVFDKTQKTLKDVRQLQKKIKKANLKEDLQLDLLHKLSIKIDQLETVSFISSNLEVKATADSTILTKGQKAKVNVKVKNNGENKLNHLDIALITPKGWKTTSSKKADSLAPGKTLNLAFEVNVPNNAEEYHAYKEPAIQASITFKQNGTETTYVQELEGTIAVLPDISATLSPENIIVNTADIQDEIPVTVKLKNYHEGKVTSTVRLSIPVGWDVHPRSANVSLSKKLEEKEITFKVSPPKDILKGDFQLSAKISYDGKTFDSTVQEINYDHIGTFYYQYPAMVKGVTFELLKPSKLKIGYIDSGFDKVADYLLNAGFDITKLTEADLATGDLNQYDTIVTGIRAYLSREDLLKNNARLLKYVEDGGHLVVQYHKPGDRWDPQKTAPFKLKIGDPSIRWRVTDENAKVTILKPDSPLFNYPNKISDDDWNHWIQERGLYYPMEWDDQYETYVSMADPNEDPYTGGILMAKYGKGTYLYTNLVFYRQIQDQVPGGYRIFTNLISYDGEK
ncbi:PIG-L family deacetylase [Bacillus sp. Gen3]|uniref:NEW3 domain-containing protein n=1 Tax=Heyndrickxia oleronia TaxID=38875 RepID=UPI0015D2D058|nr:PIG-L family deacetylase [Bacillus sp. Gen3]